MKRLVSVMVSRAAHPTRNQPRAAQRARPAARPAPAPRDRCASRRPPRTRTPRPRAAPFSPQTPAGACRPGDVVARRRAASVVQTMHGGRCLLAVHPRVPPPPPDAPYSRRRASHTGAFLARRHVWFVIACVATRGRTRPPPAHPGRRRLRLRRACLPAAHHHHRPFARRSARLSARRPALRQRLVAVLRERVLFIERYRRGHLQLQARGSR